MKISPVNFAKLPENVHQNIQKEIVETTVRHNSLADMEFNIIADTLRSQNLRNQMNVRLMNLKRNLNNCMVQNLYK